MASADTIRRRLRSGELRGFKLVGASNSGLRIGQEDVDALLVPSLERKRGALDELMAAQREAAVR